MLKYIFRRLVIMLPTLFVILALSFMISRNVPSDPVLVEMEIANTHGTLVSREAKENAYREISHSMGLDLPIFYFSLEAWAYPDTLYRIPRQNARQGLGELVEQYGNWEAIQAYYRAACLADIKSDTLNPPNAEKTQFDEGRFAISELSYLSNPEELKYRFDLIDTIRQQNAYFDSHLGKEVDEIKARYAFMVDNPQTWKLYVPQLTFYGFKNQFNHWLWRLINFDFGKSTYDGRLVSDKIADAMPWSIFMGFFSFVISFLIAIPVGVWSVRKRHHWHDRLITVLIFLMYSVPTFVTAMILMTFFCNPEYVYLFPTTGVSSDGSTNYPFFKRMLDYAWHLTLPTLTFSYGSIALVSRQMRVGMLETINLDYIRTARAKGLSEKTVVWKHAMRNSILPMLTLFSNFLPHLIGGAVIIESIYSIPGMGRMMIMAVSQNDHSVLLAVFTLSAIATLIGILLTDILYAIVDPRISFTKKG